MTAVMREALERLKASSITSSSIRFSLTGGPVGWMTNTSAPRTLSWIWNHTSPSLKRARWARPRGIPRQRQMDSPRAGWALPVNTLSSLAIVCSLGVNPRSLVKLGGAPQPPRPPGPLLLPVMDGWGGRIRTFVYGVQSPAPYRLATPQPDTTSEALRTAEPARSPTGSRRRPRSPGWSRPEPRLRRGRPETTAVLPPAADR